MEEGGGSFFSSLRRAKRLLAWKPAPGCPPFFKSLHQTEIGGGFWGLKQGAGSQDAICWISPPREQFLTKCPTSSGTERSPEKKSIVAQRCDHDGMHAALQQSMSGSGSVDVIMLLSIGPTPKPFRISDRPTMANAKKWDGCVTNILKHQQNEIPLQTPTDMHTPCLVVTPYFIHPICSMKEFQLSLFRLPNVFRKSSPKDPRPL